VQEKTDYINANYISHKIFPRTQTDYIVTQGPLYETTADFWLMCIQQRVSLIVMLCNTVESGREKCACYWSNAKNEVTSLIISAKTITIEKLEETILPASKKSIIHRKFRLTFDNEERIIDQLQYIGWPDHGVPSTTYNFRLLCKEVIKLRATKQDAPVVVHCSAGIGRTGTFLTVCILTEQMKNYREQEPFEFKIMETVQSLKRLRKGMVQTLSQYRFAYIAILEEAKSLTLLNAKKSTEKNKETCEPI
jgi:protein tyrosine phosphatase